MAHMLPYFCSVRVTSLDCAPDLPNALLPRLHQSFHPWLMLSTRVPTVLSHCGTGISTCCPSATPLGLALGPDLPRADQLYSGLTQSRSALLWKPWIFGRKDSHLPLATHSGILSSIQSTAPYRYCFFPYPMLLYQSAYADSQASAVCFSPGHFRRRTSRLVSYYALFECMAASEPTS